MKTRLVHRERLQGPLAFGRRPLGGEQTRLVNRDAGGVRLIDTLLRHISIHKQNTFVVLVLVLSSNTMREALQRRSDECANITPPQAITTSAKAVT